MYINEGYYFKTIMDDEIKIKMTSNAQVYTIKVLKSDTIQTLKEKCKRKHQYLPNHKI